MYPDHNDASSLRTLVCVVFVTYSVDWQIPNFLSFGPQALARWMNGLGSALPSA